MMNSGSCRNREDIISRTFSKDGRFFVTITSRRVPSWVLGTIFYVDGRTIMARRYNVVIQSEELEEIVKEDWSGFKNTPQTDNLYEKVKEYVNKMFEEVARTNIEDTKNIIKSELKTKKVKQM